MRLTIFLCACLIPFAASWASLPEPLADDDFHPIDPHQAELGQLLFYDPLLSGNRNIACATCHHPRFGTSDGLSLGIGEGGSGVGPDRHFGRHDNRAERRVPRNAPALWNLGAKEFTVLFHDGRASHSDLYDSGFDSPAEEFLPSGLSDIVAVQAMFPVTSEIEMAGDKNENEVPGAVIRRIDYAWQLIAERVAGHPDYVARFSAAFDDIDRAGDIKMRHLANALSAFQRFEFRADDSPFDRFLKGDAQAMTALQITGMTLFYGKANCSQCHRGVLQTDHQFHNIGLPFLGPGRTRRFDFKARDMGRINESDWAHDAYKFRTPSLRNVTETAPYGHNGAYAELADMIRHHTDPQRYFEQYQLSFARLPQADHLTSDQLLWADTRERQRLLSTLTDIPMLLSESELIAVLAFLEALTDEASLSGRLGIPEHVPSGLPVDK